MKNVQEYLDNNPIVKKFIDEVNTKIETYYNTNLTSLTFEPVKIDIGSKFISISHTGQRWGFISRIDGMFKGAPIRKGDLMKAASWAAPAKHSRGNIADGTAQWGVYGPEYLR
jgi:hypothetical protein